MTKPNPAATTGDDAPNGPLTAEEVATLREMIAARTTTSRKVLGLLSTLGVVVFVIAALVAIVFAVSAFALDKAPAMGAERYLAVVAACGAVGLSLEPFADLMKILGGDEKGWKIVATTGKLSAGLWAAVIALVAAIG